MTEIFPKEAPGLGRKVTPAAKESVERAVKAALAVTHAKTPKARSEAYAFFQEPVNKQHMPILTAAQKLSKSVSLHEKTASLIERFGNRR